MNNHETPGRQERKTISSDFPIKMITNLEWSQGNAQQNIEQLHILIVGVKVNNESTTAEPPH